MSVSDAHEVLVIAVRSGDPRVIADARKALNDAVRAQWVRQACAHLSRILFD